MSLHAPATRSEVRGVWRKSSYSASGAGQCVEVATFGARMAVRDSKNPDGPRLAVTASAWSAFVTRVRDTRG